MWILLTNLRVLKNRDNTKNRHSSLPGYRGTSTTSPGLGATPGSNIYGKDAEDTRAGMFNSRCSLRAVGHGPFSFPG